MALTENERKQEKKEKPLTKVIIRRLPPTIEQDTFLKQVSPLPDYNYIYTVNGDFSLGEFAFSRIYINFINHEDIYDFKERFDNYVFLDNKGHEYPCVVEFAPFQKIPKKRGKVRMDPKSGSIESDPIYLDFVESLKKPIESTEEKPEYTLQLTNENKNDVTTPLLEFIKNKKAQRMRIREVRREERKRREFEKKKDRFVEDRRKVNDDKSPATNPDIRFKPKVDESKEESEIKVEEKSEKVFEKSYYKNRERKYEEKRFEDRRKDIKPRYPKKEYPDTRDYKFDDHKGKESRLKPDHRKEVETKVFPKKVKKYSEKREERKIEAQKAEQKKINQITEKQAEGQKTVQDKPSVSSEKKEIPKPKVEKDVKKEETEAQSQKRIRNKDRPTIAIYRPGMLSKRKQNETEGSESKDGKNEEK